MMFSRRVLFGLGLLAAFASPALPAVESPKPKIRAITAFIRIDAKSYPSQIEEAVTFLSRVRNAIQAAGYEVSGIRISTQPFPEYTRGLSHADALSVLHGIDDLAAKLNFAPNNRHDPRTASEALTAALATHARAVEVAARKAADGSGWTYAGLDPTPAPSGPVSIGAAIESFTGQSFGAPGTETASGVITRAVKDVPVKQTGYSGLMIPVLEDAVLTRRWTEQTYGLDSILAYSAVCAGGVDTVPLAGDTSEESIARIVGDVATLAFKWNKPLATRLLPAPGKKVGEMTEFSGALANAIIQPLIGSIRR
jgi:uncharacterized protein (UPF0210 family)